MSYDPEAVATYFDDLADGEWERLVRTPGEEVKLAIHSHYLHRHVPRGCRVLEVGAGPGRFTQLLAELDCRIVVSDISQVQLDLNARHATEIGFDHAVESRVRADVCDLGAFADRSFDVVLAYGGPISYALDARQRAVEECRRVTKGGGMVVLSVMSLWGTIHAFLSGVLEVPPDLNQAIIASGDLTPETNPGSRHHCHLFRSDELRDLLEGNGLEVIQLSASNTLTTVWNETMSEIRAVSEKWEEVLTMELEASAQPGCLDMGTHLIAVCRKPRATGA